MLMKTITEETKKQAIQFINEIVASDNSIFIPIIGDFVIDKYAYCNLERKNLEHDSLILDLVETTSHYGGAANVSNIVGTFASSIKNAKIEHYIGAGYGDHESLDESKLVYPQTFMLRIYYDKSIQRKIIPVKTRYISLVRNEYLHRVDVEPTKKEFHKFDDTISYLMATNIKERNPNNIIFSDYNKGFISEQLLTYIDDMCDIENRYCNIRPKKIKNYINRATFLSFNKTEFILAYDVLFNNSIDIISTDDIIRFKDEVGIAMIIITFGQNGFIFCDYDNVCINVQPIKGLAVGSKNIIGAGDMITSAFTFFDIANREILSSKYSIDVILYLVNCCAFLKVYTGEYTVTFDLLQKYIEGKLFLL
jgi:bifunctional ADP-heptose synthase (sugar kinase/adenylyltransferase)